MRSPSRQTCCLEAFDATAVDDPGGDAVSWQPLLDDPQLWVFKLRT
jgi:hypothetical protein